MSANTVLALLTCCDGRTHLEPTRTVELTLILTWSEEMSETSPVVQVESSWMLGVSESMVERCGAKEKACDRGVML